MKKVLFGCLGLVVVLVLVAVVSVMLMDGHVEVERTKQVSASPDEVYAVVSDLHTWPEWTAWSKEADPECTWDFEGEKGDGASMAWDGPVHGEGKLTLKNCIAGELVEYDLAFMEGDEEMSTVGRIELSLAGDNTTVRWVMVAELEGVGKLLGPLMDSMVGVMFDEGLNGLKDKLGG
jgi:uncharacterized protein YndB with AHSA1/START domain